jgi:hypothetical protein
MTGNDSARVIHTHKKAKVLRAQQLVLGEPVTSI